MRESGWGVTARLIRILAVEDVAADFILTKRALKPTGLRCTVERVETVQFDGLAALEIADVSTAGTARVAMCRIA